MSARGQAGGAAVGRVHGGHTILRGRRGYHPNEFDPSPVPPVPVRRTLAGPGLWGRPVSAQGPGSLSSNCRRSPRLRSTWQGGGDRTGRGSKQTAPPDVGAGARPPLWLPSQTLLHQRSSIDGPARRRWRGPSGRPTTVSGGHWLKTLSLDGSGLVGADEGDPGIRGAAQASPRHPEGPARAERDVVLLFANLGWRAAQDDRVTESLLTEPLGAAATPHRGPDGDAEARQTARHRGQRPARAPAGQTRPPAYGRPSGRAGPSAGAAKA
jgi:hypothetical protein